LVLAAVIALAFPGAANASGDSVIPDAAIDATYGNGQRKLVEGADGNLFLIHGTMVQGTPTIVVSRSADDGETWELDAVLSRPGIRAGLGSITFDDAGSLHATWVDYETVGNVWYAVRTDGTWSDSVKISPGPTYAGFPVIASARDGLHVLWYAAKPDDTYRHGSLYEIRHTMLTPQGWSDPDLVSFGSPDALNPSAAVDRQGFLYSAWYQIDGQNYRATYAQWDTKRWTTPDAISPAASNAKQVAIAVRPDGSVYLVWSQLEDDGSTIDLARNVGGAWTDTEVLASGQVADPVLGTDPEGNIIIAWADGNDVVVQRSSDGVLESPTVVGQGGAPTLASGGRPTIAWTRWNGTSYEVVVSDIEGSSGIPMAVVISVVAILTLVGVILATIAIMRAGGRRTAAST